MKKLALLAFAAILVPLIGQEAKIMIVEKPDSQRLSRAYEKYKQAQKEWTEAKTEVAKSYTHEKGKVMEGWEKVQFSADFRAIVPETSQYAGNRWPYGCSGTTLTAVPANGTTANWVIADSNGDMSVDSNLTVKEKR